MSCLSACRPYFPDLFIMGFSLFFSFSFPPLVLLPERRQWLPISLGCSRQGNLVGFAHGFAEVFDGSRPFYFFCFLNHDWVSELEDVFMADLIREAKKSRPERSQSGPFPFSSIVSYIISYHLTRLWCYGYGTANLRIPMLFLCISLYLFGVNYI